MGDNINNLSTVYKVLVKIYEDTEILNEPVYFTKLVEEMNIPKIELGDIVLYLYDKIMIDTTTVELKNGFKARCYTISENFLPFVKGLYNTMKEDNKADEEMSK